MYVLRVFYMEIFMYAHEQEEARKQKRKQEKLNLENSMEMFCYEQALHARALSLQCKTVVSVSGSTKKCEHQQNKGV